MAMPQRLDWLRHPTHCFLFLQGACTGMYPSQLTVARLLQIQSDSRLSGAALAVGLGVPVVLWFRARYGGYGGPLSALQAFEVLQEEDALFVDIR